MKTCRDCVHYTPCWRATSVSVKQHLEKNEIVQYCADFLDRRRVIELPAGIDEVVYVLEAGQVVEACVREISASTECGEVEVGYMAESEAGYRYFGKEDIGEAVHLTREAAEAALAMRKEKKKQAR